MENTTSKQYAASATKWANLWKDDYFFKARIVLTTLSVTALSIFLVVVTTLVYLLFIQQISVDHPMLYAESLSQKEEIYKEQELLHESRETLLNTMVMVDGIMILLSIFPLYILTRRILTPIEVATKQQKRLIADVSHELRTPLAIMLSGLESALLQSETNTHCKKVLDNLCTDVTYLKNITNDLLMQESLTEQSNHISTDIYTLIQTSVDMIQSYADEKHIVCTIDTKGDTAAKILANSVHIQRLLLNILKNAIDYSPEHTTVSIALRESKKHVTLSITDQGIGMSTEDQKHITDRFYKADTARNSTGSGLGLALVADIAKAHNAKLAFTSALGKGTTVNVQFPLASS